MSGLNPSLVSPTEGRGVVVSHRDGLGFATVLVRNGKHALLAQRVRANFGIELPRGPHCVVQGDVAFLGTGPDSWFALKENGGNSFAASLIEAMGDAAAIADQSDGYFVARLTGTRVRDVLSKLAPLDFHPRAFQIGDVAGTVTAHIGATLWRREDLPDRSEVFEIAVFRSFAASFLDALAENAAEFGYAAPIREP